MLSAPAILGIFLDQWVRKLWRLFWHISEKQLLFFTLTVILEVEQAYYHHQWRYITQLLKVCYLLSYNLICFVRHIESIERNNFQSAWTRRWVIHITKWKPSSFNPPVQYVIIVLKQLCSGCRRIYMYVTELQNHVLTCLTKHLYLIMSI